MKKMSKATHAAYEAYNTAITLYEVQELRLQDARASCTEAKERLDIAEAAMSAASARLDAAELVYDSSFTAEDAAYDDDEYL